MRQKKGVSPVVAVLLLIIVAVSAGVLIYTYAIGFLGKGTKQTEAGPTTTLTIEAVSASALNDEITIWVRNSGLFTVDDVTAYIELPDGTTEQIGSLSDPPLAPKEVKIITGTSSIESGNVILVKIWGTDGSASSIAEKVP